MASLAVALLLAGLALVYGFRRQPRHAEVPVQQGVVYDLAKGRTDPKDMLWSNKWREVINNPNDLSSAIHARDLIESSWEWNNGEVMNWAWIHRQLMESWNHGTFQSLFRGLPHSQERTASKGYFKVLSDWDDTIQAPKAKELGLSGQDVSYPPETIYPGVIALHTVLRGNITSGLSFAYSTLASARCNLLFKNGKVDFTEKSPELMRVDPADETTKKLGLLSGGSVGNALDNLGRILAKGFFSEAPKSYNTFDDYEKHHFQHFSNFAQKKAQNFRDSSPYFPDWAGRYVMIGDVAQGDLMACLDMLTHTSVPSHGKTRGRATQHPVLTMAWCAIRNIEWENKEKQKIPYVSHSGMNDFEVSVRGMVPPGDGRPRFFMFETYSDLAMRLHTEGWIPKESADLVAAASIPKESADLVAAASIPKESPTWLRQPHDA